MDRLLRERVHDPYKARRKLSDPMVCPDCGAIYRNGRWQWGERPDGAEEDLCQACQRINDRFPAGEITVAGAFVRRHRAEIERLVRNQEALEKRERPLHRIMTLEGGGDELRITTTDIHLPRRIGEALRRAYEGELDYRYDKESYFIRVRWRRDA